MDPETPAAPPKTFREAELAGWPWLECVCPNGHGSTHYPWRMLALKTQSALIADILPRLSCRRCGAKPESFALVRQVTKVSGGNPTLERWEL